jgi:hypothetical protein
MPGDSRGDHEGAGINRHTVAGYVKQHKGTRTFVSFQPDASYHGGNAPITYHISVYSDQGLTRCSASKLQIIPSPLVGEGGVMGDLNLARHGNFSMAFLQTFRR